MKIPKTYIKTILVSLLLSSFTSFSPVYSANKIQAALLSVADNKASGVYVRQRFLQLMNKPFTAPNKKKALIIGDSHAQDFLNAVLENNYLQSYQIRTRYIPTRCQIYAGETLPRFIKPRDRAFCQKADSLYQARSQIAEADLIILAANWKEWSAKEIAHTLKQLKLKPQQKVFVIGRKSFGKVSIRNYLRMPEKTLRDLRNKVDAHQVKINTIMKNTLNPATFIDQQQLVCGAADSCPVFTKDLKLISFDGGHLTKEGARHVGKILFRSSSLSKIRQ